MCRQSTALGASLRPTQPSAAINPAAPLSTAHGSLLLFPPASTLTFCLALSHLFSFHFLSLSRLLCALLISPSASFSNFLCHSLSPRFSSANTANHFVLLLSFPSSLFSLLLFPSPWPETYIVVLSITFPFVTPVCLNLWFSFVPLW